MAAFSNIFQKSCPTCAAFVGREDLHCACGHSFAVPDVLDEERLYHEYLEVRMAQVRERIDAPSESEAQGVAEAQAELKAVQAELDQQRERMSRLRPSSLAPAGPAVSPPRTPKEPTVTQSPPPLERAPAGGHRGAAGQKVRAAAQELEQELARLRRGWASPFGAALAARRSSVSVGRSDTQKPAVAALKAASARPVERPAAEVIPQTQAVTGIPIIERAPLIETVVEAHPSAAVVALRPVAPVVVSGAIDTPPAVEFPELVLATAIVGLSGPDSPQAADVSPELPEQEAAASRPDLPGAVSDPAAEALSVQAAAPGEPVMAVAATTPEPQPVKPQTVSHAREAIVTVAYVVPQRSAYAIHPTAPVPMPLGPAVPIEAAVEDVRTRLAAEAEAVARRQAQERRTECPHCTARVAISAARCSCGFELPAAASLLPSVRLDPTERIWLDSLQRKLRED